MHDEFGELTVEKIAAEMVRLEQENLYLKGMILLATLVSLLAVAPIILRLIG